MYVVLLLQISSHHIYCNGNEITLKLITVVFESSILDQQCHFGQGDKTVRNIQIHFFCYCWNELII